MPSGPVRIPDDVVFEVLQDETVLLNLTTGEYYTLNRTGTRAWQLIEEHGDLGAVGRAMSDEFTAASDRVESDLDRLIGDLVERGLVALD